MQRIGSFKRKGSSVSYIVIWRLGRDGSERIDLLDDIDQFNDLVPTDERAVYFKSNREYTYGDIGLLDLFFRVKDRAVMFKADMKESINVEDGSIVLVQEKEDEKLQCKYKLKIVNAYKEYEYYETEEGIIEIDSIDNSASADKVTKPISMGMFTTENGKVGSTKVSNFGVAEYYPLDYLKSIYDLDHIEDKDLVVVTSQEEADRRLQEFLDAKTKFKCIDFESTGKDLYIGSDVKATGVVLAQNEYTSTYFPFRQDKCEFNLPIEYLGKIIDALNNQPPEVNIIAYNAMFEKGLARLEGYDYLRVDLDPFLASLLYTPIMIKGIHGLEDRMYQFTGEYYLTLHDIFKDPNNIQFNVLPPEIIKYYACPDGYKAIIVLKELLKRLDGDIFNLFKIESKLLETTYQMTYYGLNIDQEGLSREMQVVEDSIERLEDSFKRMHNISGKITSPNVKADIIYNRLRCPVIVRTKTGGKPSTSVEAVNQIVREGELTEEEKAESKKLPAILDLKGNEILSSEKLSSNRFPSLLILQKYNKLTKLYGAYKRFKRNSVNGRVMFKFSQLGTTTGRQSSDMHQCSKEMKGLVLADSKYHYLWGADFSQIELRVLAYLANETDLIEMAKDPEIDMHRAIVSKILNLPIWAITSAMRKAAKTVNFGVVYMMSAYGLANKECGPKFTEDQVLHYQKSITDFMNAFPKIKMLLESNKVKVLKEHKMKTAFGRVRLFNELADETLDRRKKASMIRAANNMPVQGFAADYMKIVETKIQDYIRDRGWNKEVDCDGVMLPIVRVMLSVHDEVLVSTHKDIVPIEEVIRMFKECMELEIPGAPPFFAQPGLGKTWLEAKDDANALPTKFRDYILEEYDKGNTVITADTWTEKINEYKQNQIEGYMNDLILKYKTPEEVAMHVRHPQHTHTLIEMCCNEKHDEQQDMINVAVKNYMSNGFDYETVKGSVKSEEALVDYADFEDYYDFDERGVLLEDMSDEEEDDSSTIPDINDEPLVVVDYDYVLCTLDTMIVDLSDIKDMPTMEKVNQAIAKLYDANGGYTIQYNLGRLSTERGLLNTPIKVGSVKDQINNIVKEYVVNG